MTRRSGSQSRPPRRKIFAVDGHEAEDYLTRGETILHFCPERARRRGVESVSSNIIIMIASRCETPSPPGLEYVIRGRQLALQLD